MLRNPSSFLRTNILRSAQRTVRSSSRHISIARPQPALRSSLRSTPNLSTRPFSHTTIKMATPGKGGVHNIEKEGAGLSWKQAVDDSKDTVMVVDAFATWCGPCKAIAPTVVKFSDKYPAAKFYKLDVDEFPEVAQELEIRAMPTFVLFIKGEKQPPVVGANPKALEEAIVKALEKVEG